MPLTARKGTVLRLPLVLAVVMFLLMFASSTWANTEPHSETALLKELAERLLRPYQRDGTVPETNLILHDFPHRLPLNLPIPTGGHLLGSLENRRGDELLSTRTIVLGADHPKELLAYYQQAIQNAGWLSAYPG